MSIILDKHPKKRIPPLVPNVSRTPELIAVQNDSAKTIGAV